MNQTAIFIESEGDAWFARNRDRLGERDPVSEMIQDLGLKPKSVLEIGCANGWRLKKLTAAYRCDARGIDPSMAAVEAREVPTVQHGTADALPYLSRQFDLVIYGFCLYVCDPQHWLRIAAEGDRVLAPGGTIIIHDFGDGPFAHKYKHHADVLTYHLNFAELWLVHPWYRAATSRLLDDGGEVVVALEKNIHAIPVRP
jgi:SAM-dependent methyltransferase